MCKKHLLRNYTKNIHIIYIVHNGLTSRYIGVKKKQAGFSAVKINQSISQAYAVVVSIRIQSMGQWEPLKKYLHLIGIIDTM